MCSSGCAYSTIQPAVAAAASGATIRIDAGTYREDVTVDKSLTLKACNGATVTWYNLTDGQRALFVPRADPGYNVVVEGITFTSDSTSGGGIHQENGALTLSGSTTVTGCKAGYGGGVHFGDGNSNGGVLVLQGSAIVTSNSSDSYGGGIYMDSYTTLEMRGTSAVTNNVASGQGGGVFTQSYSSMTMRDDASVTGNTSTSVTGGGIGVYGGTGAFLVMHDRSSVSGNSCQGSTQYDGGGGVSLGTPGYLTMDGDTIISGNATTASGGGVRTNGQVTMSGNAAIKQNTATGGSGGGIFGAAAAALTKNAPATITGNSPDQCGGSLSC